MRLHTHGTHSEREPPRPPAPANERVKLRKWVLELLLPIDILLKSQPPPPRLLLLLWHNEAQCQAEEDDWGSQVGLTAPAWTGAARLPTSEWTAEPRRVDPGLQRGGARMEGGYGGLPRFPTHAGFLSNSSTFIYRLLTLYCFPSPPWRRWRGGPSL